MTERKLARFLDKRVYAVHQGKRTKTAKMLYCVDFNNIEAVDYIKVTGLLHRPTPPRNEVKYWYYASLRELCSKQSR